MTADYAHCMTQVGPSRHRRFWAKRGVALSCAGLLVAGVGSSAAVAETATAANIQHGILFSHAPLSSPNGEAYGGNLYVWNRGRPARALTSDPDPRDEARWSPNGKQIAFAMSPGWNGQGSVSDAPAAEIFAMRADGSDPRQLSKDGEPNGPAPDAGWTARPTWSPSGRRILFSREFSTRPDQLVTVPATGGAETTLHPIDPANDGAFWWQSNGIGYLVYSSQPGAPARIELLNPSTGRSRTLADVNFMGKQVLAATWSSTSHRVAMLVETINSGRTSIVTYTDTGKKLAGFATLPPQPHWPACGLSWSPDGEQFVVAFYPGRLPYPARYYQLSEVRANGTHWQRLPLKPSTCSVSWR